MARIQSHNTGPEMIVRKAANRAGYRFRLHRRDLPGTPDLTFPGRRKVVFVHGCFWHQHEACPLARLPKSNPDYWLPKLDRNRQRDVSAQSKLEELGWRVLVIWECQTAIDGEAAEKLQSFLDEPTLRPGRACNSLA